MEKNNIDKNHNRYLTAGEFARVIGTTKHTLFHYDEIGLFTPIYRADNGYRYYSIDQLEIFDVIMTLRELDLPLSQIQEYLQHKSPENFVRLLTKEKALVDQKIAQLKMTRKWLADKSRQVLLNMEKELEEIELVECPEQYLITSYSACSEDIALVEKIGDLYDYCEAHGCKSTYNVGYIQTYENLLQENYEEYHEIYLLFDSPPKKMEYTVKPGGNYLCAYHKGHWSAIGSTYQKLLAWARERQYVLEKRFYEEYLLDALMVEGIDNYVTRIAVRCQSAQR